MENTLLFLREEIGALPKTIEKQALPDRIELSNSTSLIHLHPTVQAAASSRFDSAHYSDAIQKACTALEKAVQVKSGLPATTVGASVMTTALSKNNPLLHMADDPNEQFGFMALYQGAVLALRNHFAHSLTELTDPARALEWLSFISALFYKLDEAQPMNSPPASYTPTAGTTPLDQS
ncbi:MAG: TIGR02391 family protein [Janthinobacterium lividum]